MRDSLIEAIAQIERLKKKAGIVETSTLNLVVSDGFRIVATRYISAGEKSNSLYFNSLDTFVCRQRICEAGQGNNGVLIVSEPLVELENWQKVGNNQALAVDSDMSVSLSPITIDAA